MKKVPVSSHNTISNSPWPSISSNPQLHLVGATNCTYEVQLGVRGVTTYEGKAVKIIKASRGCHTEDAEILDNSGYVC